MLNEALKFLEKYEAEKSKREDRYVIEDLQLQIFLYLINQGVNYYVIKAEYLDILKEVNNYSNNYYAHICIMLNYINKNNEYFKKKIEKVTLEDVYYYPEVMKYSFRSEKLNKTLSHSEQYGRNVYKVLDFDEGTKKDLQREKQFIKTGQEFLKYTEGDFKELMSKKLEPFVTESKKYLEKFKDYTIRAYGRWSKQYEEVMFWDYHRGYPSVSNIVVGAVLTYKKSDINSAIKILKGD